MRDKSIVFRWLFDCCILLLVFVAIVESVLLFVVREYYYSSAKKTVDSKVYYFSSLLDRLSEDAESDYNSETRDAIESFDGKDQMELESINPDGKVTVSSSGFSLETPSEMPDYSEALSSDTGRATYTGISKTGEKIYAVTIVSPAQTTEISALGFIASLDYVDDCVSSLSLIISLTLGFF